MPISLHSKDTHTQTFVFVREVVATLLTCLPVRKYAGIVSLECIFQNITSNRIEHMLLRCKVWRISIR